MKPSKKKPVTTLSVATEPTPPSIRANRPNYLTMIEKAVNHLSERNGSSAFAIKKYMASQYGIETDKNRALINKALKKAVSEGRLLQTKGTGASGSFKLPSKKKSRAVMENKEQKAKPILKVKPIPKKTATVKPSKVKENTKQPNVIPATPKAAPAASKAASKAAPKVVVEKKKTTKRISVAPTPKATLAKPPQNHSGKPVTRRILRTVNKIANKIGKPATPKVKAAKASGRVGKIAKSDTRMNVKASVQTNVDKTKNIAVTNKNQQLAKDSTGTDPEPEEDPESGEDPESDVDEQVPAAEQLEADGSDRSEEQSEDEFSE